MNLAPKNFYLMAGSVIPKLLVFAGALLVACIVWMFGFSSTTAIGTADIYWVFYAHLAASVVSVGSFFMLAIMSLVMILRKDSTLTAALTMAIAPTGILMTVFAIGAGALFGRTLWGVYWVWDLRLTGLLIQMLFFFAFITIANTPGLSLQRQNDVRAGWVAIFGAVLLPVAYFGFDLVTPMQHDLGNSLGRSSGQDAPILISIMLGMFITYATAMILARTRTVILEREHRAVWAQDDALEGVL